MAKDAGTVGLLAPAERTALLEQARLRLWREIDPSFEGAFREACNTIDRVIAEMKSESEPDTGVPKPIEDIRRIDDAIRAILGPRIAAFIDSAGSIERAEALRTCAVSVFLSGGHAGSSEDAAVVRAALHEFSKTGCLSAASQE